MFKSQTCMSCSIIEAAINYYHTSPVSPLGLLLFKILFRGLAASRFAYSKLKNDRVQSNR
jgi:hypothetical protein